MPVASTTPPTWTPRRIQVGPWTLTSLMDAWFRLDGGAMWGVVPKNLWARMTPPAEDNSILLSARPFLAERDGVKVLLEGGMGDRWSEKLRAIYHLDTTPSLERSLAAIGVAPEDLDHVVVSHCHFDHIGGLVVGQGEDARPLLPNAIHHYPADEVAAARVPHHPRRASYRMQEDIAPIQASGRLELHGGVTEILPGLSTIEVEGHSEGMSVILLDSAGDGPNAAFWGDLIPTTHHVQPPYIMAYDIDVPRSFEQRTEWLARWADEGLIGLSYHDPDVPFSTLARDGRRYVVTPIDGEPVA